ncbi:MAG: hypothetical protein LBM73_02455 [Candidatus Nomurabacteria bacterium]|jgi:hypothetical protein|nr:hypothetical protein [Candidatus Nomurabacteria bacterium]
MTKNRSLMFHSKILPFTLLIVLLPVILQTQFNIGQFGAWETIFTIVSTLALIAFIVEAIYFGRVKGETK